MGKLRDLDSMDEMLDEHFSNDGYIKVGLARKVASDNPDVKAKFAEKMADPEVVKKRQENKHKNYEANPAISKRIKEAAIKVTQQPGYKEKMEEAARKRSENSNWVESMKNRATTNPKWLKATQENNRRKAQDPEFRAKLKEAKAKYNDDPEYRRKLREARARYVGDPEYHAKLKAAAENRSANNKEWRERVTKNRKPVLTPHGAFGSINDAGKELLEQGHLTTTSVTPMAAIKLKIKWMIKHYPQEWKFISIEEYIMLTGKDL